MAASQATSALRALRRNAFKYSLTYRTRWTDNDMYGHMNNSLYYHLFDSIINDYLARRCSMLPLTSPQIGLVAASKCEYMGSVAFPEVLELALRVVKLGKSSVTYQVAVFKEGEEAARAVGEVVHVFVDRESNKVGKEGMLQNIRKGLEEIASDTRAKL